MVHEVAMSQTRLSNFSFTWSSCVEWSVSRPMFHLIIHFIYLLIHLAKHMVHRQSGIQSQELRFGMLLFVECALWWREGERWLLSDQWVWAQSLRPVQLCNPMDWRPPGASVHFPGKNTGLGFHFLLQRTVATQGSNPSLLHLLHWQADSLPLCHPGSPVWSDSSFNHFTVSFHSATAVALAMMFTRKGGRIFSLRQIKRSLVYK